MRRLTIAIPITALAALLGAAAIAAPLPARRPAAVSAAAARALLAVPSEGASALERACGTRLDAMPDALAEAAARMLIDPLPTPHSTDSGEIAVLEDDGTFFYTNSGGQPFHDVAATARAFYRTHGDDYDFLAIYLASGTSEWLGSPGALAAAWVVKNDTQGIGLSFYDDHTALGLPTRVQALLTMNGLHRYPSDPDASIGGPGDTFSTMDVIAHEYAHRWLAYVGVDSAGTASPALLGRAYQHWNFFFDNDASFMEGCDWSQVGPDSFRTVEVSARFGVVDQYLMGVRSKAETPPFFVVNDPTGFDPPGTYVPYTDPFVGLGARGRATTWQVADIEAAEGVRVPAAGAAPSQFRVAFVLVTPRGTDATPADLAKLEVIRSRFPSTVSTSTEGRMTVDVALDSKTGHVVIAHSPLSDTEDTAGPRNVGARITIAQAGTPITLVPSSVTLYWRWTTSGAFSAMPMSAAGPDSFAASLPAAPSGTTVQYWLYASSSESGNNARLPAAGGSAPYSYLVGPDTTPPLVRHEPVRFQSRERMPQPLLARVTDNLGVDSVWCEVGINGGPVTPTGATRVGRDSFTVSIGSGVTTGGRVAYRFVARDRAGAANLGYSNAGFDTIHVAHDWYDDFENPSPFFHANVLYSWRDAWQLEEGVASPAGGVAWHAGNSGGTPYAPHTDAALYSTLITTTLVPLSRASVSQCASGILVVIQFMPHTSASLAFSTSYRSNSTVCDPVTMVCPGGRSVCQE